MKCDVYLKHALDTAVFLYTPLLGNARCFLQHVHDAQHSDDVRLQLVCAATAVQHSCCQVLGPQQPHDVGLLSCKHSIFLLLRLHDHQISFTLLLGTHEPSRDIIQHHKAQA